MSVDFHQRTNERIVQTIPVASNSSSKYIGVIRWSSSIELTIETQWDDASFTGSFLCLARKWEPINCTINANLLHDSCSANIHIIVFYTDWSEASVDWWITIHPNIKKAKGHLLEENIIIWDSVSIKTLPKLDVRSDDVEASHWATIEKLDSKKLFYIQSRGLPEDEAVKISVAWQIESLLSPLEDDEKIQEYKALYLSDILTQ